MALTEGAFGGYAIVGQGLTGVQKIAVNAEISKLLALMPDSANGTLGGSPDFQFIAPNTEQLLRAELVALQAAITAGT